MSNKQKSGGGARKIGRNKIKCANYRLRKTREKNKLRRILRSNGMAESRAYADRHGLKLSTGGQQ